MRRRLHIAELIAASNAFWFGVWIVYPHLGTASDDVRILYAPEWVWGLMPIVGGLLLAVSLWRRWVIGRIIGTLLAMTFFVGVAIIFSMTDGRVGAIPLYIHSSIFYGLLAVAEINEATKVE